MVTIYVKLDAFLDIIRLIMTDNNETTKYDSYRRNDKISGYRKQTEYGAKKYIKP